VTCRASGTPTYDVHASDSLCISLCISQERYRDMQSQRDAAEAERTELQEELAALQASSFNPGGRRGALRPPDDLLMAS
jgi:hypothetical protein